MKTTTHSQPLQNFPPLLLERIASISGKYGDLADDMSQHLALTLFTKLKSDHHFAQQQIGYQIKFAKWESLHFYNDVTVYDKYVGCEPFVIDEGGDQVGIFDEFISSGDSVEESVINHETAQEVMNAIESIPVKYQRVALLIMQGYKPAEIANKMMISQRMYSYMAKRLGELLKPCFDNHLITKAH